MKNRSLLALFYFLVAGTAVSAAAPAPSLHNVASDHEDAALAVLGGLPALTDADRAAMNDFINVLKGSVVARGATAAVAEQLAVGWVKKLEMPWRLFKFGESQVAGSLAASKAFLLARFNEALEVMFVGMPVIRPAGWRGTPFNVLKRCALLIAAQDKINEAVLSGIEAIFPDMHENKEADGNSHAVIFRSTVSGMSRTVFIREDRLIDVWGEYASPIREGEDTAFALAATFALSAWYKLNVDPAFSYE